MSAATPTSLLCPVCGAAAVPGDRFCEACGADLPFTGTHEPVPATDTGYAADVAVSPAGAACVSCGADASQIQDGYCGVCGMKQPARRDHLEASHVGVAAVTDRGRKHHRNEDAFALHVADDGSRVVAVVCDGVSTTVDPDLASQAAADAALAVLLGGGDLAQAHTAAQAAVVALEGPPPPPDLGWPSCTFLAGVVQGAAVELGTMGDCRTFWLPDGGDALTLTEDDSWAAEKIAAGALTPEQAYDHPLSHTITRWLGRDADASWTPRVVQFRADGPGRLVLCSDGLWNYAETAAEVADVAGLRGPNAVAGLPGPNAAPGLAGLPYGTPGPIGANTDAADTGPPGPDAAAGLRGPDARAGLPGPNATAGLPGPNAGPGLRGPNAMEPAAAEVDPLSVARRLVTFANERGGHDNITVIVVELKGQPA